MNLNPTNYEAYIYSLEEPDATVTRGSGRRYQPEPSPATHYANYRLKFIAENGQAAWDENIKYENMDEWEKDKRNDEYLKSQGL